MITDDEELYRNICRIRDFGRNGGGNDHYLVKGWNFKFTDIQAVIGIEQMKKLPGRIARKKEMGRLYEDRLRNIKGIELVRTDLEQTSPWFYDILCRDRDALQQYLKEKGIGTRPFYPALHAEPAYQYDTLSFPAAEEAAKSGLWLPSSVKLTDEQIAYICDCIAGFYM